MEGLVRGDIAVIPFPFSDLSSLKKRPALVLAVISGDDVLLCQITSRFRLDSNSIEIGPAEFITGGLPVTSYARCGKLFTASSSIVEKKAGSLKAGALAAIAKRNAEIILGNDSES